MPQMLQKPDFVDQDKGLNKQFSRLEIILEDLSKRSIAPTSSEFIDTQIEEINQHTGDKASYRKAFNKGFRKITSMLQKEEGLTPKAYYQTLWMSLGMAAIGLPIGLLISLSSDNFGFFASGLPIGIGVGIGIGVYLDKKAAEQGKQLAA